LSVWSGLARWTVPRVLSEQLQYAL
jgi:hypothetical protein